MTSVAFDPANPTTTNCQIGGACKVDAFIHFSSVQNTNVAFIVKFFDRCTGVTTDLPGGAFTPPGYNVVDIGPITITLPSAKSAALVAVTTSPASAASAPFLLGGESC